MPMPRFSIGSMAWICSTHRALIDVSHQKRVVQRQVVEAALLQNPDCASPDPQRVEPRLADLTGCAAG